MSLAYASPSAFRESSVTKLLFAATLHPPSISPLCEMLAAGCRVIIKPSELTPETSKVIRDSALTYREQNLLSALIRV